MPKQKRVSGIPRIYVNASGYAGCGKSVTLFKIRRYLEELGWSTVVDVDAPLIPAVAKIRQIDESLVFDHTYHTLVMEKVPKLPETVVTAVLTEEELKSLCK